MMYRQGDVLLRLVDRKPEGKKQKRENGNLILVRGEATGHHHHIRSRNADLFINAAGVMLLLLKKASILYHQEHNPIKLPEGVFEVIRQREYFPEEIRNVQD